VTRSHAHYDGRPNGPHAHTVVCKLLNEKVTALAHIKSASDIALEMGYSRPNYFLMILNGDTKLPLDKVQALAKALQVDVKLLFRLALEAQSPELRRIVDEIFDQDPCPPLAPTEPE
jgi:transcriptional regulator with XRE-family HTH domain